MMNCRIIIHTLVSGGSPGTQRSFWKAFLAAWSVLIIAVLFMNGDELESRHRLSRGRFIPASHQIPLVTPVIFIPGHGASRILAKFNRTDVIASYCPKSSDWFTLWLDVLNVLWHMITGSLVCWADNTKTVYDPVSRTMHNTPGVSTKVDGFGNTETLEFLDNSWLFKNLGLFQYSHPLIEAFISWGYVRGTSIRGAPYDYRFSPHSQPHYMTELKALIEETYTLNEKRSVAIIAHSLGGYFGLYFLKHQSQQWKDTYIHSFITCGVPWKGALIMPVAIASGWNWNMPVDPQVLRIIQKSTEVGIQLMPRGKVWGNQILFKTPGRNYTVKDNEQFLMDTTFDGAVHIYRRFTHTDYELKHPGVKFFCIISDGIPTPETYIYPANFDANPQPTDVVTGPGDGRVNTRSLSGCEEMNMNIRSLSNQRTTFQMINIANTSHVGIFSDKRFHDILYEILNSAS